MRGDTLSVRLKQRLLLCLAVPALFSLAACSAPRPAGAPAMDLYATAIDFTPDGQLLAAAKFQENQIRIYRVIQDGPPDLEHARTLKGTTSPLEAIGLAGRDLTFNSDGRQLVTAGIDRCLLVWDTQTGEILKRFDDVTGVEAIALLPDDRTLVTAGPGELVRVLDLATGEILTSLEGHTAPVLALALAGPKPLLATAGADMIIRLWDTRDWSLVRTLEGHAAPILALDFSPDGNKLLSSAAGIDVRLWQLQYGDDLSVTDLKTELVRKRHEGQLVQSIVLLTTLVNVATLGHPGAAGAPAMMAAGSAADGSARMPKPLFNCPAAFSPDGRYIAYIHFAIEVAGDYHVRVVDADTFEPISSYTVGAGVLKFHPGSNALATSGIMSVFLIDPESGREY